MFEKYINKKEPKLFTYEEIEISVRGFLISIELETSDLKKELNFLQEEILTMKQDGRWDKAIAQKIEEKTQYILDSARKLQGDAERFKEIFDKIGSGIVLHKEKMSAEKANEETVRDGESEEKSDLEK